MKGWEAKGTTIDRVMEEGSRARLGIYVYANPVAETQYSILIAEDFSISRITNLYGGPALLRQFVSTRTT